MTERDKTQKPQCFLCGKVLANGSMKSSKLKDHLKTFHPNNLSGNIDQLRTKKARFEKAGTLSKLDLSQRKNLLSKHHTRLLTVLPNKRNHT